MKYVFGNWKMHTTVNEAVALVGRIEDGLEDLFTSGRHLPAVVLCPPFVSLTAVGDVMSSQVLKLGAQNVHWEEEGPYTGEISAGMLKSLVDFVIIGHSERREAGETDEQIAKKIRAAVDQGLTPVLCVGEEKPEEAAADHTEEELRNGLSEIDPKKTKLFIAYEPLWAIGTGTPADPEHIRNVVTHLKAVANEIGVEANLLYGGSVDRHNVSNFFGIETLDGFLVGAASVNAQEFLGIIEEVSYD